jgi:chromosome segregation ATPase
MRMRIVEREADVGKSEIADLRQRLSDVRRDADEEIRSLRKENEYVITRCEVAERDAESTRIAFVEMESKYEDSRNQYNDIIDDMKEERRLFLEDKAQLERDNTALKIELDAISQDCHHMRNLLEDSAQYERENKALKKDLDKIERTNNALETELDGISQERNRLKAMLGEITNELEVAIDERENATSHYSTEMENLTLSYEREIRDLKREFDVTNEELDVMKTRAALVHELTDSLELTLAEKEEATLSHGRLRIDLRSALAETEEVVYQYSQLEKEHTKLQATKDSESHVAGLLRKQRDSLNARLEECLDEIENLRTAMSEISNERNDLKDDLICVLETAESAFQ